MADVIITSFMELHQELQKYDSRKYIFRGISRTNYNLIPKVGRNLPSPYASAEDYESELIAEFKRLGALHLSRTPENDLEWLAIAQHHGLPTRLLDWTTNPLVAAFFAIEKSYESDSGIYVLQRQLLNSNIDPEFDLHYNEDDDEIKLFEPNHVTARIIAQRGLFTIHPGPTRSLESYAGISLNKLILKHQCKQQLRRILDSYGLNKAVLFPGLDGIAEYLTWSTAQS